MHYNHLLMLPLAIAFSIDDVHPPLLTAPKSWTTPTPLTSGTCSSAVDVMAYHRGKMNEYMCRQFLAEEIVEAREGDHLQKRALHPLIDDAGSKGYKDWLARSTTLEDIYRHYEQSTAEDAPVGAAIHPGDLDFDGDVTGYAMVGNKVADAETTGYGEGTSYAVPQYGGGGGSHGGHAVTKSKSSDKGMKLQDLFQLALTAIAFLAFKTFIIEIIMCIMGLETEEDDEMEVMLMTPPEPLEAMKYFKTEQGDAAKSHKIDRGSSRRTRSVEQKLNQLAARATASLDGMENLQRDGGKKLQRALCDANLYSRSLTGTQRMWLPLWSFGISWIGGKHQAQQTRSPFGTLKFLTATIQGMAGVNCSTIFI